jgi:protein TonB
VIPTRCLALLFSLCLHGTVAGIFLFFSADQRTERVCHVVLAEFVHPGAAREASASEVPGPVFEETRTPPAPEPAAKALPLPPAPVQESPKEPEPKIVSAIQPAPAARARPAPKPAPPVAQPFTQPPGESSSAPVQAASGPRPRQFGGLSAYDQDHVDQRPSISRRVEPDYPARAKRMRIEGTVMVELVVDAAGLPKSCVIRSAEPSGYFEEAALKAAQKMRFMPGKINGTPVNTLVLLPFVFQVR